MQIASLQFAVLLVTLTLYNHFNENSSSYSFKSVDSWTSDMPLLNRYANKLNLITSQLILADELKFYILKYMLIYRKENDNPC